MVVDLETEKVIRTLATGRTPHALVFTATGKGYVNNRGEHSLTVIDGNNLTVLKTIALPATSMQFALSPDGKTLAVGYKDALLITLIDTATQRIIKTVAVGQGKKEGHSGYTGSNGSFYMLNAADGMICRINGATLTLQSRIKVGKKPMIMVVR